MTESFMWRDPTKKCPVCGKTFIPAPLHAYKVSMKHRCGGIYDKLVCSWHCLRAYEKENGTIIKGRRTKNESKT